MRHALNNVVGGTILCRGRAIEECVWLAECGFVRTVFSLSAKMRFLLIKSHIGFPSVSTITIITSLFVMDLVCFEFVVIFEAFLLLQIKVP